MAKSPFRDDDLVYFADCSWLSLAKAYNQGFYKMLAETWQKPRARIKDVDMTYRSLNYLSSNGLFPDKREEEGKGWRKLSYVECFYLTLVAKLRHFNVKKDTLQKIYTEFMKEVDPEKAKIYDSVWLDALMLVHGGHTEVYLFIDADGDIHLYDAMSSMLYLDHINDGAAIVIRLSQIANEFRLSNGLDKIDVKYTLFSDGLSDTEHKVVLETRKLNAGDRMNYVSKEDGALITLNRKIDVDESVKDYTSLVDEEYGSIKILKEGGKVVGVQKESKYRITNEE